MSQFLLEYPFAGRLFPSALERSRNLRNLRNAGGLSDGVIVFSR